MLVKLFTGWLKYRQKRNKTMIGWRGWRQKNAWHCGAVTSDKKDKKSVCARFSITSPSEAVRTYFAYSNDVEFPPLYNISPSDPVLVVRMSAAGEREMTPLRWGLIPSWVKDPDNFSTLINARIEPAREKPSFRNAIRRRRCLIPTDGFYEWSGPKGHKRPYYIQPEDEGPAAFAGLWEHWLGADGTEIETVTILTREPDQTMARIHNRMPQFVPKEHFGAWLDCANISANEALKLLEEAPEYPLKIVEVSTRVNNPGYKEPDAMDPLQRELF